ncbi:MAG: ribonuclease P protein component [Dehalococcoidia bacterium]|nr:ribonuclease P protein component [Dehalococcoidia bacterium]
MKRPWSLTAREQFSSVFREGRAYFGSVVVLRVMKNDLGASRLGLVVGKRVGGAVQRNRVKRWIREVVRVRALSQGWDIVVIARPSIQGARYQDVELELQRLLVKASVLDTVGGSRHKDVPADRI